MRRPSYVGGLVSLALLIGAVTAQACDNPRQMDGFKTCADVAKTEQEGSFVLYSTDPEVFLDWFLGVPGQKGYGEVLSYNSMRADVPPPPGGVNATELKLLFPSDWDAFLKTHTQFVREWDKITGLR